MHLTWNENQVKRNLSTCFISVKTEDLSGLEYLRKDFPHNDNLSGYRKELKKVVNQQKGI
jgi:hypothetical protein